jgi:polyhydroxybutyrate depolymerase
MASALACSLAGRIAAVAPVAGITDLDGCAPSRAVPVISFHGTADPFISYDGGLGPAVAGLPVPDGSGRTLGDLGVTTPKGDEPSIPDQFAAWAARNGCDTTLSTTPVAADVDLLSYPCQPGADVELYRVNGGGHAWPGSEFSKAIVGIVGPTTFSISADDLIWAFFQAHPLH